MTRGYSTDAADAAVQARRRHRNPYHHPALDRVGGVGGVTPCWQLPRTLPGSLYVLSRAGSKALPRSDQSDVTQKYCAREVALLSRDLVIHIRLQGSVFNSTRRQIRTTSSAEISVLAPLTGQCSPPAMAKSAGKKVQMHFCVAAVYRLAF